MKHTRLTSWNRFVPGSGGHKLDGARDPVIREELVARVMKARRGRWFVLIDIAVPRDIEPQVGSLDNVYLYDLDALQQVVSWPSRAAARNRLSRRIVEEELARQSRRERSADVNPVIGRCAATRSMWRPQKSPASCPSSGRSPTNRNSSSAAWVRASSTSFCTCRLRRCVRSGARRRTGIAGRAGRSDRKLWSLDKQLAQQSEDASEKWRSRRATKPEPRPQRLGELVVMNAVRIATRGSKLALWQAEHIRAELCAREPGLAVELLVVKPSGIRCSIGHRRRSVAKGLFTKEVEEALLDGRADLAVHSLRMFRPRKRRPRDCGVPTARTAMGCCY